MYLRIYLYCISVCVCVCLCKYQNEFACIDLIFQHICTWNPVATPAVAVVDLKKSQVDHPKSDSKPHQVDFGNHLVGKLNS